MSVTRGFLVSLLLCLLGAAVAQAQPVGPEFRVNTYTTSFQDNPSVAADSFGNFVVVWRSNDQDGDSRGVFGQRYASSGTPLGPEFQVNTFTTAPQEDPSVAADPSGNFVVVWTSPQDGGPVFGVFGQRYASTGEPLGPEFLVNTVTAGNQDRPSVAADASGNFVAVWTGQDGLFTGVFGQRYASSGTPLGPEFLVNTYTTYFQGSPSVATDASGNFVVVWMSNGGNVPQDGSYSGVFGQRYASSGTPLGPEFRVNTYTDYNQSYPSVTSDPSGNFVVVWTSGADQDGSAYGVFGQRYASSGALLGSEFRVNTYTTGQQYRPVVAADASGSFVVVWESNGGDGSGYGVFGQRYASSGAPDGPEFRVNTYTTSDQDGPVVASDASGNLVVVWESSNQDGSDNGVFGQRYSAACEASVQVKGDVHTPGSPLRVRIHIAHKSPETVTVPWGLSLIDPEGRVVAERVWAPHTFEPGDVVDVKVALPLPKDLEGGTYTLRLGVNGMAGTEGATTTFQVMRAE